MKIQIEDKLFIESDPYQFIIKEYTGSFDKKGYEKYVTHGYFTKLETAIKHLAKMKVKESTAKTLGELLQDLKRIEEYICSKVTL
ncbi:hypothetical protein J31TS4_40680 [Paenibacillus sp. J31TS4]|uniref:hypothetical protein n=1 Tax=Paenibacillus sp. J31TS4 TaxID=2807195 RepID=UPI001B05DBD0|nr:hypothetical protein [Paenibacillus sp. J31TS4]GIP40788.1 hypothetical protein J31TS4_40680 [Paenibacillus sp. J31TS4]